MVYYQAVMGVELVVGGVGMAKTALGMKCWAKMESMRRREREGGGNFVGPIGVKSRWDVCYLKLDLFLCLSPSIFRVRFDGFRNKKRAYDV